MGREQMKRREVVVLLGAAAFWPLGAKAQQPGNIPRVGILWIAPHPVVAPFHEAFLQGLRELGYVEGKTISIEARFADGKIDLLPGLTGELVRLKSDVLVGPATPSVRALRQATMTLPIVMA